VTDPGGPGSQDALLSPDLGTPNIWAMYVCHCRAVTDGEIREAITAGACDLDEVGLRCGAGVTCGGCCPLIQELLAEQAPQDRPAAAVA
jgi:bacterioferritin-associated ferredoxin